MEIECWSNREPLGIINGQHQTGNELALRTNAMNDSTTDLDQTDEDILTSEVCDEPLGAAGSTGQWGGFVTGIPSVAFCPGTLRFCS